MKVYTAFNHTYTKIFSTREKAIDYIVKKWLIESNFYLNFTHEALRECAGNIVIEHELE